MFVFNFLIFAIILFTAIVVLFFRKWIISLLLFAVVIILNFYWQFFSINISSIFDSTKGESFRVVTYNIYPDSDSASLILWQKEMFEEIKRMNPDILCLQEFRVRKLPLLEKELNKYYSYTSETIEQRRNLKGKLYSRFDLTDIRVYKPNSALDTLDYPVSFRKSIKVHNLRQPFCSAVAHLPSGDSVVVFSCHLQSNGYSSIRRQMKNKDWAKGIPNYYSSIKNAEKIRQWEACNLRYYIDSLYPSRNVIVAGDFNDFCASKSIETVTGNTLKDAWWGYGNGVGITYCGFHLFFRLDHILVNNRVTVRKIDVGDCQLSDHRPLVVDLDICNKW